VFGQQPEAQSVDSRDIGALDCHSLRNETIRQKPGSDTFPKFARSGLSERHGQDAFGLNHTALDPISELGLNAVGLAGAGTRGNDYQSMVHAYSSPI
jgi:hypothetical protein